MKFKKKIIATLVAMVVSAPVLAQNIGFEDGNTGSWTGNGLSAVGSQTLQAGSNTWTVNPYGSYMGMLTINSGSFGDMTSALSLTSASASGIQNTLTTQAQSTGNGSGTPTTAAWASKTVSLTAGQQFTLAWQYISTDYVPFNDGSIATLVKVGDPSTTAVLNNYTSQYALLGFTNPGTGDYSTGSYGATGWQTATYNVTSSGDYLLGFGVFNLDDTALSPVLYVDEVIGTTLQNGTTFGAVAPNPGTNAPDTSGGTAPPPPPPAVTVVNTTTTNGTASFADTPTVSTVYSSATIAGDYLTRTFNNISDTLVGRTTTTPTTVTTFYSDNTTATTSGTPITVSENYSHIVDVTHNDVATSATPNTVARTHVDTGSVTPATPLITPSADYSIRTGSISVAGLISRTSTTPTLFVYDRSTTTITTNDFAPTSSYTSTTNIVNSNSTVSETYNVVNTEDFTRTVTKDVLDTMASSTVLSTPQVVTRVDAFDPVNSNPVIIKTSKGITASVTGRIQANEINTITTPTRFTYNRVVTTTTADDFSDTSAYSDTTTQASETSTETGDYDVVTTKINPISAGYDVALSLRTDQIQTVNKLQGMMNRAIEFGKTIVYKRFDHSDDGYKGHTNLFGVGHNKDLDGGVNLGFGINKLDTMLTGNNSSVKAETVQLGATVSKKDVNGFDLSSTVQHSMTNYTSSATPMLTVNTYGDSRLIPTGSFNYNLPNVNGKTSGTDSSVALRVVGPGDIIRPVVGATVGTRKVNGYTGTMEVLPGLTANTNKIGAVNDTYSFGTVGAVVKYDMFNATALYHTDGVKQLGVGLQQEKENLTFNVRADRLQTNQGASNVYTASVIYKF